MTVDRHDFTLIQQMMDPNILRTLIVFHHLLEALAKANKPSLVQIFKSVPKVLKSDNFGSGSTDLALSTGLAVGNTTTQN